MEIEVFNSRGEKFSPTAFFIFKGDKL